MTPKDKTEFAQLLLTTADQYNRVFSHSFLEIYWHCLKEYSLAEIQAAFLAHFKNTENGRFMPQPSDILRILQGDSQTQSLTAWTKVKEAIRQVGSYHSIVFDDFLIHAVIRDMNGWIALCQKTEKELTFVAIEFQKRYRGYLLHRPYQYSSHLIGMFEHQNQIHQKAIVEPILFGNPQAALVTYLEGCKPHQLSAACVTPLNQAYLSQQLSNKTTPVKQSSEEADEENSPTSFPHQIEKNHEQN